MPTMRGLPMIEEDSISLSHTCTNTRGRVDSTASASTRYTRSSVSSTMTTAELHDLQLLNSVIESPEQRQILEAAESRHLPIGSWELECVAWAAKDAQRRREKAEKRERKHHLLVPHHLPHIPHPHVPHHLPHLTHNHNHHHQHPSRRHQEKDHRKGSEMSAASNATSIASSETKMSSRGRGRSRAKKVFKEFVGLTI